jgi:hypothetical protein
MSISGFGCNCAQAPRATVAANSKTIFRICICPSSFVLRIGYGRFLSSVPFDYCLRPIEHEAMADSLSSRLAPIVLPDSNGDRVRLGSLWADRPAAIVFLRHYG